MHNQTASIACVGLLVAAAAVALWATTQGLDKPLLGPHSFRQTQTAISTMHMVSHPVVFANYITPVLGKPWEIPMEVPFYQWIVARSKEISGAPLDMVGQIVSVLAWLLCMIPLWKLLGTLGVAPVRVLTVAVCLASPLYLFWGRSFMMETTGTLLALAMVSAGIAAAFKPRWSMLALALSFGIAAALCKATTWAVAAGVGMLLVVFRDGMPGLKNWRSQLVVVAVFALPLFPAKLWLAWGDTVKARNPFARELIIASSPNQAAWNFGTIEQKLNPATWEQIWRHITEQLLVPIPALGPFFLPAILLLGCVLAPRRVPVVLCLLAGFLAGPIIFTNLYFEHSYYWCANGIWILAALGVALCGIWEFRPAAWWPKGLALGLAVMVCISGFLTWRARFLPILEAIPTRQQIEEAWIRPVQDAVPPNRTILIVGNDWNPNSLYYAERKGIAFPNFPTIPFPGPQLEESLGKLSPDEALGAVVLNERLLTTENSQAIQSILTSLGMGLEGRRTAFGVLFAAKDLMQESSREP